MKRGQSEGDDSLNLPPRNRGPQLPPMLLPTSRPDATFDLHGQTVAEAERNAELFLRTQRKAGRRIVRIITGRGSQGGKAPIRTRVRTLLKRLREEGVVGEFELEASDGSYLVELK